jgi:hypothetical protein
MPGTGPRPFKSGPWQTPHGTVLAPFDVAALVELGEPHLAKARLARLAGREIAGLPIRESVGPSIPLLMSTRLLEEGNQK